MVTTVGPAVGAKAQFGYAEESKWGYPTSPPTDFFEFTSESLVSEFTNLVSAALRSDRAVHKQRIGTEAAGGDVNFEVAAEGIGTILKHGLGKKRTKRRDLACVLVYNGTGSVTITVSSTGVTSSGSSGDDIAWTPVASEGCTTFMNYINNLDVWDAYAPWGDGTSGYYAVTTKTSADTTCGTSDFGYTHAVADSSGVCLLEACTAIPVPISPSSDVVGFPLYYVYGIYDHTIETHSDLPEVTEGLTIEVGRDVAAFNYYGAKINSLAINASPGEIVTGTANFMAKGASTCGDVANNGSVTGFQLDIVDIYYAGSSSNTIQIAFNDTTNVFTMTDDGDNYYSFSVERGYVDLNGYFYDVTTLAGFIEFLQCCGESGSESTRCFSLTKKPGIKYSTSSIHIENLTAATISTTSAQTLQFDSGQNSTLGKPLIRGDYIGTDSGTSADIYVKVSTGGACDGTAAFQGSTDGTNYSTATSITAGVWYDIRDNSGTDTGFDVMFPQNQTLTADDEWKFATFKDENASATYSTLDPFVGAQGAVTLDDSAQVVMGLSFTINNNLFGDKYELGDKQRAALKEQQMAVEGSINVEFDNLDLYRKFVNGVAADMSFDFTADDYITSDSTLSYAASVASDVKYEFVLRMPNLKFSGTTPTAGGPEIITTDYPIVALYDDTNNIPNVRITLTNHTAYI